MERDRRLVSFLQNVEPFEVEGPSSALVVDYSSHLVCAVAEVYNVFLTGDRSLPGFVEFAHALLLLLAQPSVCVVAKSEVNRHHLSLQLLQRNTKLDTVGNCEQRHLFN